MSELALPNRITKTSLEPFAEKLKEIDREVGMKMSARGWCYFCEGLRLINKDQFDRVENLINECRQRGYLPVDFTAEEEARKFAGVCTPDDYPPEQEIRRYLKTALKAGYRYEPDWWEDEKYYIQMIVEKVDLKSLFEPVCEDYKIPIATSRGWSSITMRANYARRFKEAENCGKTCVLAYCIPYGETILTSGGYKVIEDITPNDKLLGSTGFTNITNTMKRFFNGNIITINASMVLPIKVTPNHPLLVAKIEKNKHPKDGKTFRKLLSTEWILANNIEEGQYLVLPKTNFERRAISIDFKVYKKGMKGIGNIPKKLLLGSIPLTENLARLFGCYLGDGSYSGCPTITFTKGDKNIPLYRDIIKEILGYDSNIMDVEGEGATQLRFGGTVLGRFFIQNFGKYSMEKKVPNFIFNAEPKIVRAFLKGYIDADGTDPDSVGRTRIATASKGLAIQIQLLIRDKFSEVVSLFCAKREGWTKIQSRKVYQHDKYEIHIYSQTMNKIFGAKHGGKVGRRKWFQDNDNIYVPITYIDTEPYFGEVFNFTTNDHTICLNNIITHNCGDHDPDGLRISEFLRSNLDDIKNITWSDGMGGYDPAKLKIDRFGLNYDFIQSNHLTWIDNLITGSGGCIARVKNGRIVRGTTVNGKPHPNFPMAYVQDYLQKYGVRKCEANALVIAGDASRDMCRHAIEKWLGINAFHRFIQKRKATIEYIDGQLESLGINKLVKEAIKAIDAEIGPEEEDE